MYTKFGVFLQSGKSYLLGITDKFMKLIPLGIEIMPRSKNTWPMWEDFNTGL